jgi:hypothetical protein
MKHFFLTLLLATLCATGHAQTIKSLGYNTTNGQVVYTGTNVLQFTNTVNFNTVDASGVQINGALFFYDQDGTGEIFQFDGGAPDEARARTNLGLGATWLTNTNVANFRAAIGLGATNEVQFAHIDTTSFEILGSNGVVFDLPIAADATRANLGLPLPALTNTSNVTMMRALAGQTNTNYPFSGTFYVTDPENDVVWGLYFSNGILFLVGEL